MGMTSEGDFDAAGSGVDAQPAIRTAATSPPVTTAFPPVTAFPLRLRTCLLRRRRSVDATTQPNPLHRENQTFHEMTGRVHGFPPRAQPGGAFSQVCSSSRVLILEKASGSSSKPTSTTFSVAYQASILRPPPFRKSARWSSTPRRINENTGCGCSPVFATASSPPVSSSRWYSRSISSAGRNGAAQGTAARYGRLETDRPACNPASGPAYPPIASLTTRTPKVLYSSWFWLALMMMPPTCGAKRSYT